MSQFGSLFRALSDASLPMEQRIAAAIAIPTVVTAEEGRTLWDFAEDGPPVELYDALAGVLARWDFRLGRFGDNYREYEMANVPFEILDLYYVKLVDAEEAAGNPRPQPPADLFVDPLHGRSRDAPKAEVDGNGA